MNPMHIPNFISLFCIKIKCDEKYEVRFNDETEMKQNSLKETITVKEHIIITPLPACKSGFFRFIALLVTSNAIIFKAFIIFRFDP